MPDLNSLREVMQNPEFLRLFSSPETLQVNRLHIQSYTSVDEFNIFSLKHRVGHMLISIWSNTEAFSDMLIYVMKDGSFECLHTVSSVMNTRSFIVWTNDAYQT